VSNRVPLETVQHVTISTLFSAAAAVVVVVVIISFAVVRVISLLWVAATRWFQSRIESGYIQFRKFSLFPFWLVIFSYLLLEM